MSEKRRCDLNKMMLQYNDQDWNCVPFDINEGSNCQMCTQKCKIRAKKRDDEAKRHIDEAVYTEIEPNPIVTEPYQVVSTDPSTPSGSSHFGAEKGNHESPDWDGMIETWIKNADAISATLTIDGFAAEPLECR